jgi:hypothetical protein
VIEDEPERATQYCSKQNDPPQIHHLIEMLSGGEFFCNHILNDE